MGASDRSRDGNELRDIVGFCSTDAGQHDEIRHGQARRGPEIPPEDGFGVHDSRRWRVGSNPPELSGRIRRYGPPRLGYRLAGPWFLKGIA